MRVCASVVVAALGLVGCGGASSTSDAHPLDAASDASTDGAPACDPTENFDPPVLLAGFATNLDEVSPQLSPDELTLYFSANPGTAAGGHDLYVAHRSRVEDVFDPSMALAAVNSAADDYNPSVSADGLMLVFFSKPVTSAGYRLYISTRTSVLATFGAPSLLAGVASPVATDSDLQPFLTADGQELWFASNRSSNSFDIYRATRSGSGFANPVLVTELNTDTAELLPTLSADRLTVYFASTRGSPAQNDDIWTAHRSVVTDRFPAPIALTRLNTREADHPGWLSPDNCRLYFSSTISGNGDIYVATRRPH